MTVIFSLLFLQCAVFLIVLFTYYFLLNSTFYLIYNPVNQELDLGCYPFYYSSNDL